MSALMYSIESQTRLIDPIYHSNDRSEFKLEPNVLLMGNIRLGNVGCTASTATTYRYNVGAWQIMKNVYLMDGGVVLDQLQDVNQWMAFQTSLVSNDKNASLNQNLSKTQLGFTTNATGTTVQNVQPKISKNTIAVAEADTAKAWLSLQSILSMLKSGAYLSTNVFKDLRLVVEYDTGSVANLSTILKPVLVYDKVMNDKIIEEQTKKLMNANYVFNPIERDIVYLPSVAAGSGTYSQAFNLKAFDGKTLNKLLLSKYNGANLGSSSIRSGNSEKVNFIVNGRQLIPYDGIAGNNQKLQYLTESWGVLTAVYKQNSAGRVETGLNLNNFNNYRDFIGASVAEKVSELQVSYSVVANATGGANLGTRTLYCFGEVNKVVNVENGEYKVAYL